MWWIWGLCSYALCSDVTCVLMAVHGTMSMIVVMSLSHSERTNVVDQVVLLLN